MYNKLFGDPFIVEEKIKRHLEINQQEYDDFIYSLKEYNTVIAGGFVLSCFSDFKSNDIDIYITSKNMKKFACNLPPFLSPISLDFISKYDSIGKKYVQRMLCYKYDKNNEPNDDIKVDIVIVDDNYTIYQVIDNFDLTFCKIWFDGDNVYASHPNDIRTKTGSLNDLYLDDYYSAIKTKKTQLNLIHQRNEKYTNRGFTIRIAEDPHPSTQFVPKEEDGIPILLSSKQTCENIIIKLILQNFTSISIIKYLMDDVKYYSKYILKYMAKFEYTTEFSQRYYIQKITLLKFYFISLFKEFTFEEFKKNFKKFFNNIRIEYVYKYALYTLQKYLYSVANIITIHKFDNDDTSIQFKLNIESKRGKYTHRFKKQLEQIKQRPYSVMKFIIDNHLNKYEKSNFTYMIDNNDEYILKDRIINTDEISSEDFIRLLQIKESLKIFNKEDVIKALNNTDLTGYDSINMEEFKIAEYLNKDNIMFVVVLPNKRVSIDFISKKDLDIMISDINDNWFYDCSTMKNNGVLRTDTFQTVLHKEKKYLHRPFIKLALSSGICYFEYNYIYSLFMSKHQVFFVYKTDKEIKNTASYKNTTDGIRRGLRNGVSTNHCQDGSNIHLYQIKTLKFDKKSSEESLSSSSSSKLSSISSSKTPRSR